MEEVPVFTSSTVNAQELTTWEEATREALEYRQRKDAFLLSQALSPRLLVASRGDKTIYQQLLKIKSQLDFMAMPLLDDKEVISLFRDHLDVVLTTDIDVWDQLRFKLTTLVPDDRDTFKSNIQSAMEQCQCPMSALPRVKADGTREQPTLANWLKDFRGFMEGRITDTLRSTEFFTKNISFRALPVPDQEKLKMLFTIYQWLHHSTFDLEGFEGSFTIRDTDGSLKVFDNGVFASIKPLSRSQAVRPPAAEPLEPVRRESVPARVDPMEKLKMKYAEYRISRQRILDIEDKVLVKSKGDPHEIYHELSDAVQAGDKYRAIACLKILARERSLSSSLRDNPSWWGSTAEYITQKYTGQYPAPEVKLAVSNLKLDPTTPTAVSEFLQFVLKVRLKLSEAEAALIGVEIGQLLGGEYQSMAYGNAETGEFEWVQNKITDRKLVSGV
ncbi:MAG: hypothetical protein WC544_03650 [Patescibacteria group bacterium]